MKCTIKPSLKNIMSLLGVTPHRILAHMTLHDAHPAWILFQRNFSNGMFLFLHAAHDVCKAHDIMSS